MALHFIHDRECDVVTHLLSYHQLVQTFVAESSNGLPQPEVTHALSGFHASCHIVGTDSCLLTYISLVDDCALVVSGTTSMSADQISSVADLLTAVIDGQVLPIFDRAQPPSVVQISLTYDLVPPSDDQIPPVFGLQFFAHNNHYSLPCAHPKDDMTQVL